VLSASWTSSAPATLRSSMVPSGAGLQRPHASTRTFGLVASTSAAPGPSAGATSTSTNCFLRMASAVLAVERAVERNDAAERGHRIGRMGMPVGLEQMLPRWRRRRDWRA
jgi:hypothetical protein